MNGNASTAYVSGLKSIDFIKRSNLYRFFAFFLLIFFYYNATQRTFQRIRAVLDNHSKRYFSAKKAASETRKLLFVWFTHLASVFDNACFTNHRELYPAWIAQISFDLLGNLLCQLLNLAVSDFLIVDQNPKFATSLDCVGRPAATA